MPQSDRGQYCAFPITAGIESWDRGLTIREVTAIAMLQGFVASRPPYWGDAKELARAAVHQADALLAELAETS